MGGERAGRVLGRVLVADDDANTRQLLSMTLRAAGFEVVTAPDGVRAVRAAATTHPDVVVLDVTMPGKNGFDAADEMRASDAPPAVLFLTARHSADHRLAEAAFLTKPFALADLVARVRALAG
ncbi:DNA-binding response OmpR family regulator [Catenuloplanes nepalensis]|uniref:DNA-binding response OmpR family regulator n=1 Tax=Catenuloplanes nepalensis TaxID=587533 RepID=A0ABT9N1D8_9ACTN|nr:response regulator [Catenuloplanes nepalensis]MDP9797251.1 DNA-binding response OmpR family regulator [Catenuloplanes nepalensis]